MGGGSGFDMRESGTDRAALWQALLDASATLRLAATEFNTTAVSKRHLVPTAGVPAN
jgi:hypothetical protein